MLDELSSIPYSSIRDGLYTFDVIATNQERKSIEGLNGQPEMRKVLDIIILSLVNKQNTKFKGFLMALKNGGWKNEAQKLGE